MTGRVLYVDADRPQPALVARARRLVLSPVAREGALERSTARRREARALRALVDRATAERSLEGRATSDGAIVASLQSGEFEVVPDPFPSAPRARILVVDDDPTTHLRLERAMPDADVVATEDGWEAIDRALAEDFDAIVVALVMGEWRGTTLYKMLAKERPSAAARVVFVAESRAVDQAPPSAARARILSRPIDAEAVRALMRAPR